MKSIFVASLIAGALALDSSFECSQHDEYQAAHYLGCYSGPYGNGTTDIVLEEYNGDSGVLSWKGTNDDKNVWECNHAAFTRKTGRFVFRDRCVPGRTQSSLGYEIEICPDQDAIRFTSHMLDLSSDVIIIQKLACPGEPVTV